MDWHEKVKKTGRLFKTGPSLRGLSVFCRQLGILLDSGMMVTDALHVIAGGQKKAFQEKIMLMRDQIENGMALGKAAAYSGYFPSLFVEMMDMAEHTGGISEILNTLSDYYGRQDQLRSDLLQITLYPCIVLVLSIAIVIFLLTQVVPVFVEIITSLSGEVPLMTRIMVALGQGLSKIWILILPITILILILRKNLRKETAFSENLGRLWLKIPFIGKIILDHGCMQLTQGLSLLIRGGINLPESLTICKGLTGNMGLRMALKRISGEVKKGRSLTVCMAESGIFPGELCQMLRVGEETGDLVISLEKASAYYLGNFNRKTKFLTTLMEPLVMMVVGGMVLMVMLSMMQPIYQIYQSYVELM